MMPASDTALDFLHARATEFFTGALEASSIESAFDRRIRFEDNTLKRLIPDGSGPDIINLSQFKRIFVIALGKAAGPMLEILLDRMKRRKGLRGICCTKYVPKKRNWRIRYFEGGHPVPNEASFASARAALTMLKKAKKDTLIFFLISGGGSAMFDLPLDAEISLNDTIAFHEALLGCGAPINEINTLRKHFSAVKGGRLAMAAPEALKVSFLLPDVPLRTLDALSSGPTSPDHSTVDEVHEIIAKYDLASKFPPSVRAFFERSDLPESPGNKSWRPPFLSRFQKGGPAPSRRFTSAVNLTGEDEAFRDSVFELLLSSHDLVESARVLAQKAGYFVAVHRPCRCVALSARPLSRSARSASPFLPHLRWRGYGHPQSHAGSRRPQSTICAGMRARACPPSRRDADRVQRRVGRHRREHPECRRHCRSHDHCAGRCVRVRSRSVFTGIQCLSLVYRPW